MQVPAESAATPFARCKHDAPPRGRSPHGHPLLCSPGNRHKDRFTTVRLAPGQENVNKGNCLYYKLQKYIYRLNIDMPSNFCYPFTRRWAYCVPRMTIDEIT